jgi:hypothetical protein
MDHNSPQFLQKAGLKCGRIFSNAVNAYVYIREEVGWRFRKFKRYNICVSVMIKVLLIYAEQVLVGAKNVIDVFNLFPFFLNKTKEKFFHEVSCREIKRLR